MFLERAVKIASHRVEDCVLPNIAKAIKYYVTKVRTKDPDIFAFLLGATAASISGNMVLKINNQLTDTHYYVPALNLFIRPYLGEEKFQPIDNYCDSALEHMDHLI